MQLVKVHFHAYKSLVNEQLGVSSECIGLVGINESGKSNILSAIACLSPDNQLTKSDAPKMTRGTNPELTFEFELSVDERQRLIEFLDAASADHVGGNILNVDFTVFYKVKFDLEKGAEERVFTVKGVNLPDGKWVRRPNVATNGYMIQRGDGFKRLEDAAIVSGPELAADTKIREASREAMKLDAQIEELSQMLEEASTTDEDSAADEDDIESVTGADETTQAEEDPVEDGPATAKQRLEFERLKARRLQAAESLEHFDPLELLAREQEALGSLVKSAEQLEKELAELDANIKALQEGAKAQEPTKEVTEAKKKLAALKTRLSRTRANESEARQKVESLGQPLKDKFSQDVTHLRMLVESQLDSTWLPKVVFWQHKEAYILDGEYRFSELQKADDEKRISRPLMNLFRIGIGVTGVEDLKSKIQEIRNDPGERSRYQSRLNRNVGEYLKQVWPEYDQEVNIALEERVWTTHGSSSKGQATDIGCVAL